jgi:hypothetical protein
MSPEGNGRIHHLDRNWNSQASGYYVSILQLSFTISVLSIAYSVLYVYVVTSPLPPCSFLLFPPLVYQLCLFFNLHLIGLARACGEYYRHANQNHCPSSHIALEIIELHKIHVEDCLTTPTLLTRQMISLKPWNH